jgi:hypothetical protein
MFKFKFEPAFSHNSYNLLDDYLHQVVFSLPLQRMGICASLDLYMSMAICESWNLNMCICGLYKKIKL